MADSYKRILIATDFSRASARAVTHGGALAQRFGAEVTLMHVFDPGLYERLLSRYSPEELEDTMKFTAEAELVRLQKENLTGLENVELVTQRDHSAAQAIVEQAEEEQSDLCVIGSSGGGGLANLLGGVATRVVRHAPCDVLVVSSEGSSWPPQDVVVGADFSKESAAALKVAGNLCGPLGARVTTVHVHDDSLPVPAAGSTPMFESTDNMLERLSTQLATLAEQHLASVAGSRTRVMLGASPASGLCQAAEKEQAGLIIVGTHGRSGITHMLIGSVAERVVREAQCPVLVVRG